MNIPLSIKPYLIGGVVVGFSLFLLAFYLRGQELDRCEASLTAIETAAKEAYNNALMAEKQLRQEAETERRKRERLRREIDAHDKSTLPSPAVGDAIRMLCNQGATCNPSEAGNSGS